MEATEHAATVVTLVILRSYYEFYTSCAKSACITISKSIFVYTKSKDSLTDRFAAFRGKLWRYISKINWLFISERSRLVPLAWKFYKGVEERLVDLVEHGNFSEIIFHNFSRRISISENIGLDVDKQNSYFGIYMRELLCSLQEFDWDDFRKFLFWKMNA